MSIDIPDVQATLAWVFFGLLVGTLYGCCLATCLETHSLTMSRFYGILLCQAYWYFHTYKDPISLRILVGTALVFSGRLLRSQFAGSRIDVTIVNNAFIRAITDVTLYSFAETVHTALSMDWG